MSTEVASPLTGLWSRVSRDAAAGISFFEDSICGDFGLFDAVAEKLSESEKRKLAMVLATINLRRPSRIIITLERSGQSGVYTLIPFKELLLRLPEPQSLLDEALLNLSKKTTFISDPIHISAETCWSVFSYDPDSQDYILRQLSELGYIKKDRQGRYGSINIESKGWERLQGLQVRYEDSNQIFVAMWFHEDMQETYVVGPEKRF